jgi:hypothetical protein
MGHSVYDPGVKDRRPWNAGRMQGAKPALKPQQVWAIRFWLDHERRLRDRAMFDLAIDSKLRGCDVVKERSEVGTTVQVDEARLECVALPLSDEAHQLSGGEAPRPSRRGRHSSPHFRQMPFGLQSRNGLA